MAVETAALALHLRVLALGERVAAGDPEAAAEVGALAALLSQSSLQGGRK